MIVIDDPDNERKQRLEAIRGRYKKEPTDACGAPSAGGSSVLNKLRGRYNFAKEPAEACLAPDIGASSVLNKLQERYNFTKEPAEACRAPQVGAGSVLNKLRERYQPVIQESERLRDPIRDAPVHAKYDPTNPDHAVMKKRDRAFQSPEIGDDITGFPVSGFSRHGGDWGQSFITDDFFFDAQPTDDPGMLFQGHIPVEEPPNQMFNSYRDFGQAACGTQQALADRSGTRAEMFPMEKTPAWVERAGTVHLSSPGRPSYLPPENVMLVDPVGRPPKRVKTIYNPIIGPGEIPSPFSPTTDFGGPFSDNPLMPWGPDSFMSPHFFDDAHDCGAEWPEDPERRRF